MPRACVMRARTTNVSGSVGGVEVRYQIAHISTCEAFFVTSTFFPPAKSSRGPVSYRSLTLSDRHISLCLSTCHLVRYNRHNRLQVFALLMRARIPTQHLCHQWLSPLSARTVECRKTKRSTNGSCLTHHKTTNPLYAPRSIQTERGTRGVPDEALPTTTRRM